MNSLGVQPGGGILPNRAGLGALAAMASQAASPRLRRAGWRIATFLDVTSAQTALTKARTADTDSQSAVFATAATLAFSTGDLAPPPKESER